MNHNYIYNFYKSFQNYPDNIAVVEKDISITYKDLAQQSCNIANFLRKNLNKNSNVKIGVLGSRSIMACTGVIASGWAGYTYLPISPKLPVERIKKILQMAEVSALIVDQEGYQLLKDILSDCPDIIISTTKDNFTVSVDSLLTDSLTEPFYMSADNPAYLIFTSGTTGIPKGVEISCDSLNLFSKSICELFNLTSVDKTVETCELNFDFSVYNMFAPWYVGASLYIIPREQMMNSVKFVKKHNITVWSSVPSVIALLQKVKALSVGSMPSLRLSAFCGEPLTLGLINDWQNAAPNGVIKNLYGPTEATVFCLNQNVEVPHKTNPNSDIYAIGKPFLNNTAIVLNESMQQCSINEIGELAIGGTQLALGYFNEPELTNKKFIYLDNQRWYLTGDLAFKDDNDIFYCAGRVDNQIKFLGHRIELEDIDSHIRKYSASNVVATILHLGKSPKLISFIEGSHIDIELLYCNLKKELPYYMIPTEIKVIENIPLTANGKINRNLLTTFIEELK